MIFLILVAVLLWPLLFYALMKLVPALGALWLLALQLYYLPFGSWLHEPFFKQWLFAPVYMVLLLVYFTPWGPAMRQFAIQRARLLTDVQRQIVFPLTVLIFVGYMLGHFDIGPFPTFYNGKYL